MFHSGRRVVCKQVDIIGQFCETRRIYMCSLKAAQVMLESVSNKTDNLTLFDSIARERDLPFSVSIGSPICFIEHIS